MPNYSVKSLSRRIRNLEQGRELKYTQQQTDVTNIVGDDQWATAMFDAVKKRFMVIDKGTGVQQRIADKITVTSIHLRGFISNLPSVSVSTAPYSYVRMLLVRFYQHDGTNNWPDISDVLSNPENIGGTSVDQPFLNMSSWYNIEESNKYKVLHDETFMLSGPAIAYDPSDAPMYWNPGTMVHRFDFRVRLGFDVTFSSSNHPTENELIMFVLSDFDDSSLEPPQMMLQSRVYYYDT